MANTTKNESPMEARKEQNTGWFFKPYLDEEIDADQVNTWYYAPIVRAGKKNASDPFDFPLFVSLTETHFQIYWRGYAQQKNSRVIDYSVHLVFSTEINAVHRAHFSEWFDNGRLLPKEYLNLYINSEKSEGASSNDTIDTYLGAYFENPKQCQINHESEIGICLRLWRGIVNFCSGWLLKLWLIKRLADFFKPSTAPIHNAEVGIFYQFVLGLLFDLQHSSVFRNHPSYLKLIAFLESIPKCKAIWLKAEHRFSIFQLFEAKKGILHSKNTNTAEKDRINYWDGEDKKASERWLAFLRSPEASQIVKENKESSWFEGVEREHRYVYEASNAEHIKKQAEDSVQWLLDRYALWRAYLLQFGQLYSCASNIIILSTMFICCLYVFFVKTTWFKSLSLNSYHYLFGVFLVCSLIVFSFVLGLAIERILYLILASIKWIFKGYSNQRIKYIKRTPEEILFSIPKIVTTLKPRILLASAAVWAYLLTTDMAWSLDFHIDYRDWLIIVILYIFTLLFLSTHLSGLVTRKRKFWRVLMRSTMLCSLSIIYTFIIGFISMGFASEAHFTKGDALFSYFTQFHSKGKFKSNDRGEYAYMGKLPASNGSEVAELFSNDSLLKEKRDRGHWLFINGLDRLYRDTIVPSQKVCFTHGMEIDEELKSSPSHFVIVVESLLFFTFIAAAFGLMLEMGLEVRKQ